MNSGIKPYGSSSSYLSMPSLQKAAPLIAGSALAVFGLSRRSNLGLALAATGGLLAFLGSRVSRSEAQNESLARGSVLLNCSPEEAYRRYRNFEDLPTFMHHLDSVTKIGDQQYRWVAVGPLETKVQWDAEVVEDRKGEFISWRSLPGSELTAAGSVRFKSAPNGRGTVLTALTHFDHPAGKLGAAIAKLFAKDPSFLMQQDLRRFKALLETGEIPTTEGQTHGPRSGKAASLQAVDPDEPRQRKASTTELFQEQRRTA